ncbi:MAG: ADP-glyceromanno-heptose 6-epimerase [Desulfovibrio sp.]|nr:ADP-glyceromanno-heptose 6-epimerase [Desulfovibrio sp.]
MIVVTGGAGFIGSVLLWQLNKEGIDDILVVDHLGKSEKWQNLVQKRYRTYMPRERFVEHLVKDDLGPIEAIVHLGACSSTTESDCDFLWDNNVEYSKAICQYGASHHIRTLIASSAATYGDGSQGFSDDPKSLDRLRPLNMYGYSKHVVDQWLVKSGLIDCVCSLKFFNVYGPNEYHKGSMQSVVVKAYHAIQEKGSLALFSSNTPDVADGMQRRDFVYVKDVAHLLAWLLTNRITGIRNVGTSHARTFLDLGKAVFRAMNKAEHIEFVPMPSHLVHKYQNYTCASMDWLRTEGVPITFRSLEEGVFDYVRHLNQAPYL